MKIKGYKEVDADFKTKMPIEFSTPELFFGEGEFYLIEDQSIFCTIKIEKKIFFKIGTLVSRPFSTLEKFDELEFLNSLVKFLEEKNICDILNPTLHFFMCSNAPDKSYNSKIGSIVIDLKKSYEEILKNFSSNYRNEIKKIQKENWKINKEISLNDYYSLYKTIQKRQNLYTFPIVYFEKLQNIKNIKTYLWTIKVNDSTEGFVSVIQDGKKAYYLLGGATFPTLFAGSNKLLQLEVMKSLKENGVESYYLGGYRLGNLDGTKYKGIQNYKKRFGAIIEDKKVFYVFINPFKAKLYQLVLKIYLKTKGIKSNNQGMSFTYEK